MKNPSSTYRILSLAAILVAMFTLVKAYENYIEGVNSSATNDLIEQNTKLKAELKQAQAELMRKQPESEQPSVDAPDSLELDLQKENAALKAQMTSGVLRNPTWSELKAFLLEDKTNERTYVADKFDCVGFALKLRDNARARGYRAAYVEVGLGYGTAGHALNLFETSDYGMVFIDNIKADSVAYVDVGREVGLLGINAISSTHLECEDYRNCFGPLKQTDDTAQFFDYAYYEGYERRRQNFNDTVTTYNLLAKQNSEEAQRFNDSGQRARTTAWRQAIEKRANELRAWARNIDALRKEFKTSSSLAGNHKVAHIEVYW